MTDLLERAVAVTRELPSELQNEIARLMLSLAGEHQPPILLTADEEASFATSLAQADSGEFASNDDVRAVWSKHGL